MVRAELSGPGEKTMAKPNAATGMNLLRQVYRAGLRDPPNEMV